MATCEKHGEYEEQIIDVPLYAGRQTPIKSGCPKCAAEAEAREVQEEAREAEDVRRSRLVAMNIEKEFFDASLDNFVTPTPELQHNLIRVRELVAGNVKKIVMLGKHGNGKTHLGCAALQILGGRILTMYEISTLIRASYTVRATETELEIVQELAHLPLLVIDEIGRTKGGDAEANWLSYIIDKRHVRKLPLILISNKHARADCKEKLLDGSQGCPDCLENYIGEDIMSRLCEDGVLLKFSGDDYRKRRLRRAS